MPQTTHAKTFFIKPAAGLRIADPATGAYLPAEGALMPKSGFWLRRFWDGDVIQMTEDGGQRTENPSLPSAAAAPPEKSAKKEKS